MNITSQVTIRHQGVTCTTNPARTSAKDAPYKRVIDAVRS